jgi:hypothetical protein
MKSISKYYLILILAWTKSIDIQSQTFQSIMTFQHAGTDFLPSNPVELIATLIDIPTLVLCYFQCNMNPLCRTFVSDITWPFSCHLYAGLINTGTIIVSSSSTSQVGGLRYDTSLYSPYNQTYGSNSPSLSRYLVCTDAGLHCPMATYWNKGMCLSQVYFFVMRVI